MFILFAGTPVNSRSHESNTNALSHAHMVKDVEAISNASTELREAVGPLPLTESSANGTADGKGKEGGSGSDKGAAGVSGGGGSTTVTKNVVLSDGTYATQTSVIGERGVVGFSFLSVSPLVKWSYISLSVSRSICKERIPFFN